MSYNQFLSETQWNELIETKTFQIVDQITEELLSKLNEQRCLFLQTIRESVKIPYDRHKWSHSRKGSIPRHQPAYKNMVIEGIPTHSIRCTSVNNEEFKKDIVHVANTTYYHYFLTEKGVYREPEEGEVKKPRITDDTAERLRDILKQHGSTRDAFELAQSEGLQVSRRQCHNQVRNIRASSGEVPKVRQPRIKKKISLEQLDMLKQLFPNDVTIYTDANNQVHYQIKLFVSGKIDPNEMIEEEEEDDDVDGYEDVEYQMDEEQTEVKEEPIENVIEEEKYSDRF